MSGLTWRVSGVTCFENLTSKFIEKFIFIRFTENIIRDYVIGSVYIAGGVLETGAGRTSLLPNMCMATRL